VLGTICKVRIGQRGGYVDKKITRRDFLKLAGFGVFTVLILPGLKRLNLFRKSHKEAKYYEKLAG